MAGLSFSHDGIVLPVLVPLAELKTQLRVTDAAHDADIAAIGAAAQDAIVAYLTTAVDPTWTAATVPRTVAHAIKLLAAFWYEHRGDDEADAGKAWEMIGHLLGRHRDPTLA